MSAGDDGGFSIDPATVRTWKRYPAYKDSGVEWIGEVPAGWDVKRLKYLCQINPSKSEVASLPKDTKVSFLPMELIGEDCSLTLTKNKPIDAVWGGYTYFRNGDVIVAKITPCFENGKGALCDNLTNGIAFGTTELHVLRAGEKINPKFLFLATKSYQFRKLGADLMTGTAGQKRVPDAFIRDYPVGAPPLPEQHAVAAFLDRETARLDALIAKKQRFIELLEEKRQALITQAVTKGLDPDAEMKDSGIEWLGEVPAGWEVIRNRVLIDSVEQGWSPVAEDRLAEDDEWAVIKLSAISKGRFYPLEHKVLSVDYDGKDIWKINPGDLLITRSNTRELVGNVCLVDSTGNKKLILSDLVYKLNYFKRSVNPSFIKYWMLSRTGRYQIERDARGSSSSMVKISQELIKFWFVVVPQLPEQRAIAAFLDRETARIDAVIDTINQQIEKLHEYRTALISAVVTGKIDVRGEEAV